MSLLGRIASGARVPVFAIAGAGGRERVQDLRLHDGIELVASPRHACVLLIAGVPCGDLLPAAFLAHDQMPTPRATVLWGVGAFPGVEGFSHPERVPATGDVVGVVRGIHTDLVGGGRASEPPVLPDVEPHPWRGVGPHGQGGEGMMGGTPFGRPMAMTGPDRDGLALDVLPLTVGPLHPALPTGLVLDVDLQGDVLQRVRKVSNAFRYGPAPDPRWTSTGPRRIADLEIVRARSHLRWTADMLRLWGLDALGRRTLRLATSIGPGDRPRVRRLRRWLDRVPAIASSRGVGRLPTDEVRRAGGPVARAAGHAVDARSADPAYSRIGFEPIVGEGGDVRARFRQRLAEAEQALDLAARAGDAQTEAPSIEGPRGPIAPADATVRPPELRPGWIEGEEWGDAVAVIASLDLDLEAAARSGTEMAS